MQMTFSVYRSQQKIGLLQLNSMPTQHQKQFANTSYFAAFIKRWSAPATCFGT